MKSSVAVIRVLQVDEDMGEVGKYVPIATRDQKLMYKRLYRLLKTRAVRNVPDLLLDDLLIGYRNLVFSVPKDRLETALSAKNSSNSDKVSARMLAIDDENTFDCNSNEEWSIDQGARVETAMTLIEMYDCLKKRLRRAQREELI